MSSRTSVKYSQNGSRALSRDLKSWCRKAMTIAEFIKACKECGTPQRAAELLRDACWLAAKYAEQAQTIQQYVEQVERLNNEISDLTAEVEDKRIQLAELGSLSTLINRLEKSTDRNEASADRLDKLTAEIPAQTAPPKSKKQVSKKTDSKQSEPRAKYGEYKHVLLTGTQYANLVEEFGVKTADEYIQKVDEYCQQNGKTYKDYNLTVRKFMREDKVKLTKNSAESGGGVHSYDVEKILQYSKENIPKLKGGKK